MRIDRFVAAAFGLMVLGLALPASAVSLTPQQVQDRAAIEETMSRYMFALDTADPDAYASVYAPDGEIVLGKSVEHGHDALRKYVADLRKRWGLPEGKHFGRTRHIYYNFTVDINGDKALAQTYWQTLVANPDGGAWKVLATGTSEDSFVKIGGSWLIAKRVIHNDPAPEKAAETRRQTHRQIKNRKLPAVTDQDASASSDLPRTLHVSFNDQLGYAMMGMAGLAMGFLWRGVSPVPGYALMAVAAVFLVAHFVRRPSLVLDRDGYTTTSFLGQERVRWSDVDRFEARKVAGRMSVAVTFAEGHAPPGPRRRAFGLFPPTDNILPHSYGLTMVELADLMNGMKARFERGEA